MTDMNDNKSHECCCNPFHAKGGKTRGCGNTPDPFTEKELKIFAHLRMLKQEVSDIKSSLKEIDALLEKGRALSKEQNEQRDYYTERIEALREEWARLKIKGDEAARERMIALGHID